MAKIEDFIPGRFVAVCAVIGKATDGGDYIHNVGPGRFKTIEAAMAAIDDDKRYWGADQTLGGLIEAPVEGDRVYRVFDCPSVGIVHKA